MLLKFDAEDLVLIVQESIKRQNDYDKKGPKKNFSWHNQTFVKTTKFLQILVALIVKMCCCQLKP